MTHSPKTISPLRQRMIEDMTLRELSPQTQSTYIRAVINLTRFLGRSPHTATALAGAARPQETRDHGALCSSGHRGPARGRQSTGIVETARLRPRACLAPPWRSRMSSALTGLLGGPNRP